MKCIRKLWAVTDGFYRKLHHHIVTTRIIASLLIIVAKRIWCFRDFYFNFKQRGGDGFYAAVMVPYLEEYFEVRQ